MRTIAVLNQKGGVGKTTTVVNTAAALAAAGHKVVVIDLDPQAHLTIHLGIEPQDVDDGSYKVLIKSARFEAEIVLVRANLWLLPANINLVGAESELVSVVGREIILREAIEASKNHFDYCFIDCAPSLGLLTLNALAAAEEVLIPLQPHFLALQGLGKLLQTVELVNRRINPGLKVRGVLLCMFDSRTSLSSEVRADIEQFLDNARNTDSAWADAKVFPTYVRRNIKLAEAPSYGKTIFEYEESCHGAEDYRMVAEFIHTQYRLPPQQEILEPAIANESQDESYTPDSPLQEIPPAQTEEQQEQLESVAADKPQDESYTPDSPLQETPPAQNEEQQEQPVAAPPIEIKEIPPQTESPVQVEPVNAPMDNIKIPTEIEPNESESQIYQPGFQEPREHFE